MLTLSEPTLALMLKDGAPAPVVSDYLTDQGVSLGQVLLLFAGEPPEWQGGLPKEVLAAWVRENADHLITPAEARTAYPRGTYEYQRSFLIAQAQQQEPEPFWLIQPLLPTDKVFFTGYQWQKVEDPSRVRIECLCSNCNQSVVGRLSSELLARPVPRFRLVWQNHRMPDGRDVYAGRCEGCRAIHWTLCDDGPEVRALKREVLGLFPEVGFSWFQKDGVKTVWTIPAPKLIVEEDGLKQPGGVPGRYSPL